MALFGTQAARAAGRGAARRALLSLIGMGALLLTAGAAEAALRAGEAERV
ncbi:MAG: hypothetical protein HXY25_02805, partial [Alphaproteobacteria bacterium]|nr:hypothetical protein [Alphaproteobacteria bacterium]